MISNQCLKKITHWLNFIHPVTRGRRCFIWRVHKPKGLGTSGQGHIKSQRVKNLENVNEVTEMSSRIRNINRSHFDVGTCGTQIPSPWTMSEKLCAVPRKKKKKRCFNFLSSPRRPTLKIPLWIPKPNCYGILGPDHVDTWMGSLLGQPFSEELS